MLKPVDRAVAVLRDPVRVDRAFFNVILVQAENSPYLRKGEECAGSVVARGNAFELSDKRGELPRRRHRSEPGQRSASDEEGNRASACSGV